MNSKIPISVCLVVLLAGCSIPAGLSGNNNSDEPMSTPEPTPLPTQTPPPTQPTQTPTTQPTPTPTESLSAFEQTFTERVYTEINQSRAARGLSGLDADPQLQRGAGITAEKIATHQYFTQNRSQNTTSVNVYQELSDANVTCARSDTGSVYVAKLYYQQYVNVSNEIVYYETPGELADAFLSEVTTTRSGSSNAQVQELLYSDATTRQGVGVYRDADNVVYIVYLSCE
jgi:uncharacterized protein YkwD